MSNQFFQRLRNYYLDIAAVLRGEAKAASIFPNPTDIGISRERVYAEFLSQHAPSKCNVFFGGFLFGEDGSESGQLDVIITTDTAPRFNFHNQNGNGKSFSSVEGTLGVASIKSTLNQKELENALNEIARIPSTASLEGRVTPGVTIKNYDDWPYKIIYASDGISAQAILRHLESFYTCNSSIPQGRRPHIIHVAGKYLIFRTIAGLEYWDHDEQRGTKLQEGEFIEIINEPDLQAILWVLENLQQNAMLSTHIFYSYSELIKCVNNIP